MPVAVSLIQLHRTRKQTSAAAVRINAIKIGIQQYHCRIRVIVQPLAQKLARIHQLIRLDQIMNRTADTSCSCQHQKIARNSKKLFRAHRCCIHEQHNIEQIGNLMLMHGQGTAQIGVGPHCNDRRRTSD